MLALSQNEREDIVYTKKAAIASSATISGYNYLIMGKEELKNQKGNSN
jgi:hypothetical protein